MSDQRGRSRYDRWLAMEHINNGGGVVQHKKLRHEKNELWKRRELELQTLAVWKRNSRCILYVSVTNFCEMYIYIYKCWLIILKL